LFANSIALLASSHITSVLGYVFWITCARGLSAGAIGMASIVISAMTVVAIIASTGFEPVLTRVLPGADPEERSGLCGTALIVTAVVSGIAGVIGALLLPQRVHDTLGTGWLVGTLGAGAVGTALLLVINAALLGVRRAELTVVGGVAGSLARVIGIAALLTSGLLVAAAGTRAAHTIIVVWAASLLVSFALSAWLLARTTPGFRFRFGWIWLARLRHGLAWDHVSMLAARMPGLTLPILASALFPAAQVGYMTMTLMLSAAFFAVSASVSNSLLAHCADSPERLREEARRAARLIGVLLVIPVVVTCILADKVLGLFGSDYADYAPLLILLLVATIPDAVVNVAVAILRVQHRQAVAAAATVTAATSTLVGAWLLMPHLGIAGAGWAPLVSLTIVATALIFVARHRSVVSESSARPIVDLPACDVGGLSSVGAMNLPVDGSTACVVVAEPADDAHLERAHRSSGS